MTQPRGIRNNNPLNIRKGNDWQGERHPQADSAFEEFQSIDYGLRAAFIIIRNYIRRKIDTPEKVISTWAPKSENNTAAYVKTVCLRGVLQPNEHLVYKNKNQVCRLLWAMSYVECGLELSFGLFENAYVMANRSDL